MERAGRARGRLFDIPPPAVLHRRHLLRPIGLAQGGTTAPGVPAAGLSGGQWDAGNDTKAHAVDCRPPSPFLLPRSRADAPSGPPAFPTARRAPQAHALHGRPGRRGARAPTPPKCAVPITHTHARRRAPHALASLPTPRTRTCVWTLMVINWSSLPPAAAEGPPSGLTGGGAALSSAIGAGTQKNAIKRKE